MIIGFADITGKGHLTSQLCFVAGLFSQFSEKKHLIISRRPFKLEYYMNIKPEDAEKKRKDLLRLVINGQLSTQLLKDYSIPISKGLDYLDVSFIEEKEKEYHHVLYEYVLDKAREGYGIVFADMRDDLEFYHYVDRFVLCMPQSVIDIKEAFQKKSVVFEKGNLPLLLFGSYFADSKWTRKRLTRGIEAGENIGIAFSYELFDAFQEGRILEYLQRKYMRWEREYKILSKFVNGGEERRK